MFSFVFCLVFIPFLLYHFIAIFYKVNNITKVIKSICIICSVSVNVQKCETWDIYLISIMQADQNVQKMTCIEQPSKLISIEEGKIAAKKIG